MKRWIVVVAVSMSIFAIGAFAVANRTPYAPFTR
jgi:hypothetical protein